MSDFVKIARHPISGKYELASYKDNYFGEHVYGVKFPSDGKVFPIDMVDTKKVKNFWAADVRHAFTTFFEQEVKSTEPQKSLIKFLNLIEDEYKARWNRDKVGGEGAVEWYKDFVKSEAQK